MKLQNQTIKRLGIFFFYDRDGIVDRYVTYLLDDIVKSFSNLIVVCNGKLNNDGYDIMKKYTPTIIIRENRGLDVGAYKAAFNYLGWNALEKYEEVVLFNNTIMGPIYSFVDVFESMNDRDLDFWGLTKYGINKGSSFKYNEYDYIPEHIQSHFMSFRTTLLINPFFQSYWDDMPEISSYEESIGRHESVFTKIFSDRGFKWDVYVDSKDFEELVPYPLMFYAKELIEKRKCPIFKRRIFFQDYGYVIENSKGEPAAKLYEFLKKSSLYDVNMIWENILRTYNQYDIVNNLHLNYVLSPSNHAENQYKNTKVALCLCLFITENAEQISRHLEGIPNDYDIFIVTDTEEKRIKISQIFKWRSIRISCVDSFNDIKENMHCGMKDNAEQLENYEYVCCISDLLLTNMAVGSAVLGDWEKAIDNTIYDNRTIEEIISIFDENPRLGLLTPPVSNYGMLVNASSEDWKQCRKSCEIQMNQLGQQVPMSEKKEPLRVSDFSFWFRIHAMKSLINFDYEKFKGMSYMYSLVAQANGYYPATILSEEYARIEVTNLRYFVSNYNRILHGCNFSGRPDEVFAELEEKLMERDELYKKTSLKWQIKNRVSKILHLKCLGVQGTQEREK